MPLEAWRELALRELGGGPLERLVSRTAEGLRIDALHPSEPTVLPGRASLRANAGWTICPEYSEPDARAAGVAIATDLRRGAQAVWVRLDEPAPVGLHGVVVRGADDLAALLAGVDPTQTSVTLAAGADGLAMQEYLSVVLARRGLEVAGLRGLLGCDPLGALARRGQLGGAVEQGLSDMSEVAGWARGAAPGLRTALVDVGAYHDAGATAADQLAALLATGVAYLRALTAAGASVAEATRQMGFAVAVGRDLLLELAKLRAARLCWARLVAACGGDASAQRMHLHARGSWRERTTIDPWVGLLRGTGETVAAALGGADSIATTAMDAALGEPGELGRRIALNTQIVLAEEAHLGRVADPAGGAGAVEALTDQLARAAWTRFQRIEAAGGMAAALRGGLVQADVADAAKAQAQAVASVRAPIVGVSRFAAKDERPTGARAVTLTVKDLSGELVKPLVRTRLAEPFEALRGTLRGERVALVAVGEPAQWRARVEFCRAYLEVGGFEVVETPGTQEPAQAAQQYSATGARAAVICSADAVYATTVPGLVPLLRGAGAVAVLVAGRPKDQVELLTAAGVDLFVQPGGDAPALLASLQRRLEVRS